MSAQEKSKRNHPQSGSGGSSSDSDSGDASRAKLAFAVWQPPSIASSNAVSSSIAPIGLIAAAQGVTAAPSLRAMLHDALPKPAPHQIQGTRILHAFIEQKLDCAAMASSGALSNSDDEDEDIFASFKLTRSSKAGAALSAEDRAVKPSAPPKIGRSLRGLEDDPSLVLLRRVAGVGNTAKSKKRKRGSKSSASSESSSSSSDEAVRKLMLSAVVSFPTPAKPGGRSAPAAPTKPTPTLTSVLPATEQPCASPDTTANTKRKLRRKSKSKKKKAAKSASSSASS